MKYLSREWLMSLAAFVFGLLQSFGVIVPEDLSNKIVGAVIAVAALVAWVITRTSQKKSNV